MARKFGKVNVMKVKFSDYSYIVNGIGGIGKTTLAHELGLKIGGSDEGTFIVSIGEEPTPDHIDGAFGDVASDWKTLDAIIKELCTNKSEYPDTKFVALDSADELFRIAEEYIVATYNSEQKDAGKRVKSIKQCYGGFQAGENKVVELVLNTIFKLRKAGYSLIIIGHTKVKSKVDPMTEVSYEQLTCNLDGKYFNAIKDKVNLVATCYIEREMENVTEKKNAFSKEMQKIGKLASEKRVICFRDDNMTVDTKSHFKNIESKIEFSTDNFIKAVETAIKLDLEEKRGKKVSDKELNSIAEEQEKQKEETVIEENEQLENEQATEDTVEEIDESPFFEDDEKEDEDDIVDTEQNKALMTEIKSLFVSASKETKDEIKQLISKNGDSGLNTKAKTRTLKSVLELLK